MHEAYHEQVFFAVLDVLGSLFSHSPVSFNQEEIVVSCVISLVLVRDVTVILFVHLPCTFDVSGRPEVVKLCVFLCELRNISCILKACEDHIIRKIIRIVSDCLDLSLKSLDVDYSLAVLLSLCYEVALNAVTVEVFQL